MLTIGNIRYLLKRSNVRQVARDTGIAYSTLAKLSAGHTKNPTYELVKTLTEYFSTESE